MIPTKRIKPKQMNHEGGRGIRSIFGSDTAASSSTGSTLKKSSSSLKTFQDTVTGEMVVEIHGHKYDIDSGYTFDEDLHFSEPSPPESKPSVTETSVISENSVKLATDNHTRTATGLKAASDNCVNIVLNQDDHSPRGLTNVSLTYHTAVCGLNTPVVTSVSNSSDISSIHPSSLCQTQIMLPVSGAFTNATEVHCRAHMTQPVSDTLPIVSQVISPFHSRKGQKSCRLWEFIRNLLLNPATNPSYICWVNKEEGVFKIVQPRLIANIWGMKKGNRNMTYEKMSRAMRYYYKRGIFAPVPRQRHVYQFGTRARGWREGNDLLKDGR